MEPSALSQPQAACWLLRPRQQAWGLRVADAPGWMLQGGQWGPGSRLRRGVTPSPINIVKGHLGSHGLVYQGWGQSEGMCLKPRPCQSWGDPQVFKFNTPSHFTGWETGTRELGNLLRVTQSQREQGLEFGLFLHSVRCTCPLSIRQYSRGWGPRGRGPRGRRFLSQPSWGLQFSVDGWWVVR